MSYKVKSPSNAEEQVAFLLERSAYFIIQAKHAIEKGDIAERFIHTEKVNHIITGLSGIFNQEGSPQIKMLVEFMEDFCQRILMGLMAINQNNDGSLCVKVAEALQQVAFLWKQAPNNR
ncbi:MAG: flagellar protein FliS [Proteobacteria bacterium]|nr:flagellar protein FliS [Pseudomonadota bacterium]